LSLNTGLIWKIHNKNCKNKTNNSAMLFFILAIFVCLILKFLFNGIKWYLKKQINKTYKQVGQTWDNWNKMYALYIQSTPSYVKFIFDCSHNNDYLPTVLLTSTSHFVQIKIEDNLGVEGGYYFILLEGIQLTLLLDSQNSIGKLCCLLCSDLCMGLNLDL
jgi:hypothetical protein